MNNINIGTSGWHYDHWQGAFYPKDLPKNDRFGFYLKHFSTVEINNTFYQLPEEKTLRDWRDQAGEEFNFSIKASRYITHMKKLKDPKDAAANFFRAIEPIKSRSDVILFQLPPRFRYNGERLKSFLEILPDTYRYAFEFRDKSWENEKVYRLLSNNNAALCIYDMEGRTSPGEITSDFIYVRLHGPGRAYEGSYDKQTLSGWAGAFSTWSSKGKEVFCYFDNDQNGYAAKNAMTLKNMLNK